jgi:DNA (cytosine-5)-methyltransferase 1
MTLTILGRTAGGLLTRPLLLDLYCCQGGAAAGYAAAGFDIVGIDITPQPRYPFPFIQADALAVLRRVLAEDLTITVPGSGRRRVAACHASCPCQRKTRCQKIQGREHPALIAPTRELLQRSGLPWVIENVVPDGPDDDPLIDPVLLCGAMFGLHTYRHHLFEASIALTAPAHPRHGAPTVKMGRPITPGDWYHAVGNFSNVPYVRADLGVPWMNRDGIRECIPPAYTAHTGTHLLSCLSTVPAAGSAPLAA